MKATNEWKTEAFLQLFQAQFNPHFFPPSSISRRSHAHIFNPHLLWKFELYVLLCAFGLVGKRVSGRIRIVGDILTSLIPHTPTCSSQFHFFLLKKKLNIKKSVVAKSLSPLFSHSLTRFFFYYTRWWLWKMCFAFEIHLLFFSLG